MESQNAGLAQSISANGGSQKGSGDLNSKFKIIQQMEVEVRHSLKKNAPHAKSVREFGASVDMGSGIGMIKVNTAESTKIQAPPEIGKGSIFDIVF